MKLSLQSIKENLLVFAVFMGLILPLRLLFYEYLHSYWLGSVGLFSGILFLIFYLSNKGKLGSIGKILTRKITQRATGKLGISFILGSIIAIYLCSIAILGSTYADPQIVNMVQTQMQKQGIHDMKSMVEQPLPKPTLTQLLVSILVIMTPDPISFAMFKGVNDLSNGWLLSLFTVILIEEVEVLGIVLFLRYRNNKLAA